MITLVADISNGRTKLALEEKGNIVSDVRALPTRLLTVATLHEICAGWPFAGAAVSSVVPDACVAFREFAGGKGRVVIVKADASLPVAFGAYPGVATLGGDRVANAVAVACLLPALPLVVIDAGTATTADVVLPAEREGEKPRFLGGAIAPGVGTMVRALHGGTAQLPEVPLMLPAHAVGQNTVEALQNGCVRAYRGLLRELLSGMEHECGCRLHPVLTGGDAPLLAELMPELGEPDPLLTLRGIALCAENMIKC